MSAKADDWPRAEPPSPRTLRGRRRTGLLLAIPGAALLVTSFVLRVMQGPGTPGYLIPGALGLLLGVLGVIFLRRVWSAPGQPQTAAAAWGRRASSAFLNLWGLSILVNALRVVVDVTVPFWLRNVVAAVWALALVATAGLALYDRPPYASSEATTG